MKICPICKQQYERADLDFCLADGQPLVESAHSAAPQPQSPPAPFSASLALALFASRFIENVPPEKPGVEAFCQPNVKVTAWRFITEVPMSAFWYLLENNCIRFTLTMKTGILRSSPTLVIEANPAAQVNFPGLEYDFWEIIRRSPGITVEKVYKQFLGRQCWNPEENLADRLAEWLIQLGYGQPDTSPKPFFRLGRVPLFEKFAPDCRRIAAQEFAAREIHRRWMKFRAEKPDVFYYLFDDVVDAGTDRIRASKHPSSDYWYALNARSEGRI